MGRETLYAGEIRRMGYAELVVHAYRARSLAESWPEFAKSNKAAATVLNEAERLANG